MGACDIQFELDGKKTFKDVEAAFKQRQSDDARENGSQSGYSGDFQTVERVEDHSHKVFASKDAAYEYCYEHAKKWDSVIAVKYKVIGKIARPKSVLTLDKRITEAEAKLTAIVSKLNANTFAKVSSKKFVTCTDCKSRVNTKKVEHTVYRDNTINGCPVCNRAYITKTERKQWEKAKAAVETLKGKRSTTIQAIKDKAAAKSTATEWLIAGWGAC